MTGLGPYLACQRHSEMLHPIAWCCLGDEKVDVKVHIWNSLPKTVPSPGGLDGAHGVHWVQGLFSL